MEMISKTWLLNAIFALNISVLNNDIKVVEHANDATVLKWWFE